MMMEGINVDAVYARGATHSEPIVKVPAWSDGTPVADATKP